MRENSKSTHKFASYLNRNIDVSAALINNELNILPESSFYIFSKLKSNLNYLYINSNKIQKIDDKLYNEAYDVNITINKKLGTIENFINKNKDNNRDIEGDIRNTLSDIDILSDTLLRITDRIHFGVNAYNDIEIINNLSDKAKKYVDDIMSASALVAVKQHSIIFNKQSKIYRNGAIGWGIFTIASIAIAIYTGYVFYNSYYDVLGNDLYNLEHILIRFFILASFIYIVMWSSKNFSASMHNYVVNKFKSNALNTFEVFTNASSADDDVKKQVLLQATNAIFSQQNTGYTPKEPQFLQTKQIIDFLKLFRK